MYEVDTSSVQIKGHQYGHIPIRGAVRQGCPMSMDLYNLSPPIPPPSGPKTTTYKDRTPHTPTSVVTYADDMTIFMTSAADFAITEEASAYMKERQVTASTLENLSPSR